MWQHALLLSSSLKQGPSSFQPELAPISITRIPDFYCSFLTLSIHSWIYALNDSPQAAKTVKRGSSPGRTNILLTPSCAPQITSVAEIQWYDEKTFVANFRSRRRSRPMGGGRGRAGWLCALPWNHTMLYTTQKKPRCLRVKARRDI